MANPAIDLMFGYSSGELIGASITLIVPEILHAQQRAGPQPQAKTGAMQGGRDRLGRRKDASEFLVEVALNPVNASQGDVVLGVILDVSERRRMERLKDEFVATVSHELRTPLTSITGALGLLMGNAVGGLPEAAIELIRIAFGNSERLVRLVNDILDIEKMESGELAFNLKRMDVRPLVEQSIEGIRGFALRRDVHIRFIASPGQYVVRADPDRLMQIITNLLSNAIKFSPTGGEISVDVGNKDGGIHVSVRDHGPGVPADFRSHIFHKFAQADASDAREKGGTGLGLSIVKQIITRLGGKVGFDDAPGGGSVFYIDLPTWDHIVTQEIDPDSSPESVRVLLCENDLDTAVKLRGLMAGIGCSTDFACTIDDALVRATSAPYSALVVDLDLPDGGDGLHLIVKLRERAITRDTPIVAIATDPHRWRDDPRAPGLNVQGWLAKPLAVEHLAQVLTRAMVLHVRGGPTILHVDDDSEARRAAGPASCPIITASQALAGSPS